MFIFIIINSFFYYLRKTPCDTVLAEQCCQCRVGLWWISDGRRLICKAAGDYIMTINKNSRGSKNSPISRDEAVGNNSKLPQRNLERERFCSLPLPKRFIFFPVIILVTFSLSVYHVPSAVLRVPQRTTH